jgi:colicin import membrane protein
MKRMILALAVVFAVAGLSACNPPKAPDAGPAQASFDAAKAAGVDAANADLKTADDKLTAAKAEIDKQNKKFSMMRDYKGAEAMLNDSKSASDKALADKKAADDAAAAKKAADEAAAKAKKGGKKPMKKK